MGNDMPNLGEVLRDLEAGYYLVPEIQRGFVWRNPQIREFITSIYNEEPVGSIIYWDPPPDILSDEAYRDIFKPLADDLPIARGKNLIIDGQQRLTSLLLVKRGELTIRGRKRRIKLFFNPEEERFELGSEETEEEAKWFNVTEVLNAGDLLKLIEEHAERDPTLRNNPYVRQRLQKLQNVFQTYDLPLIRAKLNPNEDFLSILERIARIFIHINSTGTRVKMPDLALALLTAKTRKEVGTSFRERFEQLLSECENLGFEIEEPVLVRAYSAIAANTTKFKDAREELEKKSGADILRFLKETGESIIFSIKLLQELGVKSEKFLQSRYLMVPIAYILYREVVSASRRILSERLKLEIARWLILASFEKRYTGRLETELLSDVQQISQKGLEGLYENLSKGEEIKLSDLKKDYENRHLTMLLLLYNRTGALDWNTDEKPRPKKISELDYNQLTIHHIFAKEYLERRNIQQDYDLLGNITIISDVANKKLKFKDPKEYLSELEKMSPELLEKHCIPRDRKLWDVNRYEDFVSERVKLIASKIEKEFNIKVLSS
jgi:hypothetical protein